jgi:hypothetical protein
MTKRICIAIAAGTLLIAPGACKKEPTTTPSDTSNDASTDEVDASDDETDEPADESEAEDAVEALTKSSFDETINEHMSEVSDCYVQLLESNPDAKGTLEADFTFGADGVPTSIVAGSGSTLTDESLLQCIHAASKGWGFGVPKQDGMTLRYTFHLAPAG